MTKKELKQVEIIVEKVLNDMLNETMEDDDEANLPIAILDEMEDFMGEPIMFMGIS